MVSMEYWGGVSSDRRITSQDQYLLYCSRWHSHSPTAANGTGKKKNCPLNGFPALWLPLGADAVAALHTAHFVQLTRQRAHQVGSLIQFRDKVLRRHRQRQVKPPRQSGQILLLFD